MDAQWSQKNFPEFLANCLDDILQDTVGSLENKVREAARTHLSDWQTAKIFPVVGFHPEYMEYPELIGVALVGRPRRMDLSATYLYALEDGLPEKLIEWIDQIMELGDGLDCACHMMLAYHRAIIPVNGETLWDYDNIFEEVFKGKRSTNYLKLSYWNKIPAMKCRPRLLHQNTVLKNDYDETFQGEWT